MLTPIYRREPLRILAVRRRNRLLLISSTLKPLRCRGNGSLLSLNTKASSKKNPMRGIHFLLGRLLLSRPDAGADAAERAKQEFLKELQIDPNNAGAQDILGEIARREAT